MTESRTRPALGHKAGALEDAKSNALGVALPSGQNEMSHELSGIQHATPQHNIDDENCTSMNHKLHIVLRDLLKKNKLSARRAAKACGVPLSTFNGYLKPDRHQIDPNHLLAVAKHFGVSLDFLLSGQDSEKRLESAPTKKIFSRWVKLTIEEIAGDDDTIDILKGGRK